MSYKITCSYGDLPYRTVPKMPKVIKSALDKGADYVRITNIDESKEEFDRQINELRLLYCRGTEYRHIRTSENEKWTNPYYFHIPGEANSTISVYEAGDHVEIKKIDIDEVIALMIDRDITTNEVLSDKSGLRGIPSYEKRLLELEGQLANVKQSLENIKNMFE